MPTNFYLKKTQKTLEYMNLVGFYNPFLGWVNDTHREKLCLLNSVQEWRVWLLLTFFLCLRNQLSSTHSIITY